MRYVKDSDYATSGSFNQTPSTYPSTEIALFNKPILKTPGGSSAVAIKPCISVGFSRYLRLGFQALGFQGWPWIPSPGLPKQGVKLFRSFTWMVWTWVTTGYR